MCSYHLPARPALLAVVAVLAAFGAPAAVPAARSGHGNARKVVPGTWCGGTLWRLMTLSDVDRRKVVLRPTDTDIAAIAALPTPKRIVPRRTTDFQLHAWRMEVVVDRYRIASNGEIVLVLYSIPTGQYMNAYMPNPHCLGPRARRRSAMVAAREELTSHCAQVTPAWQLLGASAVITGVGYWNPVRTTRGALPNGAELRPITAFRIVSGCGVP
jgi:hypothetical protein